MTLIESPVRMRNEAAGEADDDHPIAVLPPSKGAQSHAPYALGILTVLNVINLWHRNLLYNLSAVSAAQCSALCEGVAFEPLCTVSCASASDADACSLCADCRAAYDSAYYNLKDGACVSNAQYGTLAGFGFTLMFALVGLFAGRLCDTMNRRLLHAGAVLVWSAATGAGGLCTSYGCVLASRVAVAVGEAFNAPACYSLLDWYFPAKRSTANGIYSTGTYLGAGLSSLCILAASAIGWRRTSFAAGCAGLFMASLLYNTVEQPPSRVGGGAGGGGQRGAPPGRVLRTLCTTPRVLLLLLASSLRMIGTWVGAAYLPTYFHRAYPAYESQYSVINGVIVAAGGVLSSSVGGALADRWGKRSPGGYAWVPALGAALGLMPAGVALFCGNFYVSMAALGAQNLLAECWLGPGMAILQREVPRDMVGVSVAVLLFCNTVTANVGPWIISAIDPGTDAVRDPIFCQLALSYLGSALVFGWLGVLLQRPRGGKEGGKKGGGSIALVRWLCGGGGEGDEESRRGSDTCDDDTFEDEPQTERTRLLNARPHHGTIQLSPMAAHKPPAWDSGDRRFLHL
ncbi:major facilitator superfamily domain-containing protein [Tribonema minus]|uniref:Major facilitator superfamily domain-containing protein n=1 Tax=Tribonema minus TaxID=303371 RepID=A0A835Z7U8_9STRA|nr:major facilitator superfamily domain-containing protein [Tribonema minus]